MDQDCEIDHFCWYKSPTDASNGKKECLKMYSQDKFKEFGYKKDPSVDF